MSTWSYKKAPTFFPTAVATVRGWENPATSEVLVAVKNLTTKRADANILPTYTLSAPTAKTYTAGQVLSFILNSNEAVHVRGTPSIDITMGAKTAQLVYNRDATIALNSGGIQHVFSYTVVAGDTAASGALVVANTISLTKVGTGKNAVTDTVLGGGGEPVTPASLTFTAPSTTGIVIAG